MRNRIASTTCGEKDSDLERVFFLKKKEDVHLYNC